MLMSLSQISKPRFRQNTALKGSHMNHNKSPLAIAPLVTQFGEFFDCCRNTFPSGVLSCFPKQRSVTCG